MKNLDDLKFLSPDGNAGSIGDVGDNEPDVITPDEDNGDDEDDEDEGETDEEADEENEEEDKEDKEDELELSRVSYNDIKAKFPTFFKDFPALKHAFFREQQFTELFPTIEDAKKAIEDQQQFQEITESVLEGDAGRFLTELKNENPESLENFVSNFLPAVEATSKELFFNIMGPRVRGYVKQVFEHGNAQKDDNIKNAAKVVHKILFGGDYNDIERDAAGDRFHTNGKEKVSDLDKDKQEFFAKKYQTLYSDVTNTCYGDLDTEITRGLKDLDKEKGLQRVLLSDIKQKVLNDMEKDSAYLNRMQSLWKREQRTGFSGQLRESLRTTFMAKAKTLIPKIRAEARKEVLGKDRIGGKEGKPATRLSGGKESRSGHKAMTSERQRNEKLTTRQVFEG